VTKVTLQTIANELQVSKSLISKIINNRDVSVSDKVRQQVLDKIKEYNYVPNRAAAALNLKRMQLIACIVINTSYDYYSDLVYNIEQYAFRKGYNVVLCNAAEDVEREKKYLEMYGTGLFDGILVATSDGVSNRELLEKIHNEKFPLVFVDRYIPDLGISIVATENHHGASILTTELIQRGRKRIDFVGYGFSDKTMVQRERFNGYTAAMQEHGLKPRIVYTDNQHEHNLENMFRDSDNRPDALVMISSWQIQDMLRLCRKYGLKIPRDILIATFDEFRVPFNTMNDIQNTKVVEDPILIIKQDVKRVATTAVDVLLDEIESGPKNVQHFINPYFE